MTVRIVIDTNVWVSGLLWRGKPWRLLRLAEDGKLEICIAYPMLLELTEVLAYPQFRERLDTLGLAPQQLATFALSISLPIEVSREGTPIVEDDPDDDIFLLCAIAAHASYVVSADSHLLRLGTFRGVKISTIDEFLAQEFDIR